MEATVRTRRLLWTGALLRMGHYRLPKRVVSGKLESAGKRGPGGEGERMDGMRVILSSHVWHHGDWSTAALDPGVWYTVTKYAKGVAYLSPRG